MSVKQGIPITQLLRGPDRDYTVANILHAFVNGESVTLWSYDGSQLVPNRVSHVARVGQEYVVKITDEKESFFFSTSSQPVLTNEGMVQVKDLEPKHKLIRPTQLHSKEVAIKARQTIPRRGLDPMTDERDYIYSVRLEGEPHNVVAGRAILETEIDDTEDQE